MPPRPLRYRTPLIASLHLGAAALALVLAYVVRFDFAVPAEELARLWVVGPALLGGRLLVLMWLGVFRGSWRHAGVRDAMVLARATALGSGLTIMAVVLLGAAIGMPRSIFVLEAVFFFGLAGSARVGARLLHERRRAEHHGAARRKVLVIGDDDAAERFVRQCQRDGEGNLRAVGLVTLQPVFGALAIHGVPVVGALRDLPALVQRVGAELVVIALSEVSGPLMREIIEQCERSGCAFKAIPTLREILAGRARMDEVREVCIEDVLGRRPVQLAPVEVERDLTGAVVLVTGAAGSIGAELARQVAGFSPRCLVLLDQAESPLYFLEHELARTFPSLEVHAVLGDIADVTHVHQLFDAYRPTVVFHAAAYKHVPLMEEHPGEAVRNNVLGTLHVATAAVRAGARKFVLISTDKAVNPTSIMGASKRLAELVVLGHPQVRGHGTDFRAVRFGNVLGSAGSVVPLFQRQLAAGGPLTVTHPDVRRYFMTIPEAVELVLQAAALPEASDRITMLDMGEPVRILDLAEQLIRLAGRVPYTDVDITFTGLRPGEKLNEDLMALFEEGTPTSVQQIRMLRTEGLAGARLHLGLDELARMAECDDAAGIRQVMQHLVPEAALGMLTPFPPVFATTVTPPPSVLVPPRIVVADRAPRAPRTPPVIPLADRGGADMVSGSAP
ncbi:MAG: polysaccharide biosynthesis protein [Gemmatimonas sp.]|uniref:polysaccharide biosynthesis protein n=1 Tax=Gemmatimonas sp. TaxID=1962908 RepID=UPI00391D40E0